MSVLNAGSGLGSSVASVTENLAGVPNLIGETMGGGVLPVAIGTTAANLISSDPQNDPNAQQAPDHHKQMKMYRMHRGHQKHRGNFDQIKVEQSKIEVSQQKLNNPEHETKADAKLLAANASTNNSNQKTATQRRFAAAGPA